MSNKMKERRKENNPYVPHKGDSNDQMPGRTDPWGPDQREYLSLFKLSLERMREARVVVFVDSRLHPAHEHGRLLGDVVNLVPAGSSL